jgi:hypothetical protein
MQICGREYVKRRTATQTQNCPSSQSEHMHTEREVSELIFRERRERRAAQESNLLLRQNHCQP